MSTSDQFRTALPARALPPDGVEVWLLDLDHPPVEPWLMLSPAERSRAERLCVPAVRARFVSCRASVRVLLGSYLGVAPAAVPLAQGCIDCGEADHGPLRLDGHEAGLSLSRSGSTALLAVSAVGPLGVDLELRDTAVPVTEMVDTMLSQFEQEQLALIPIPQQRDALLAAWVQKEAFTKALGTGLRRAPDTITVSMPPRQFAVDEPGWSLSDLSTPTFAAALATRQPVSVRRLRTAAW